MLPHCGAKCRTSLRLQPIIGMIGNQSSIAAPCAIALDRGDSESLEGQGQKSRQEKGQCLHICIILQECSHWLAATQPLLAMAA